MTIPSAISPVFVDHSDLATLNQAVSLNASTNSASSQQQQQQFWASLPRPAADPTLDVLEVALPSARLVNLVSFDLAKYPHTATLQYCGTDGTWLPMADALTQTPAMATVLTSVPAVLPKATTVPGHLHPQHSYNGHWEQVSFRTLPVRALKVRLLLRRTTDAGGPVDGFGNAVSYSLAVMNFAFGYQVAAIGDIPRTGAATSTTALPIATTEDVLGSSVDYALRVNQASSLQGNTSGDLLWRSEPQPFSNAVVNFYADLRDADGAPQVFDQIFIDPINVGAHITVYYSDDLPVGGFNASAEPLTAGQAVLTGNASVVRQALVLDGSSSVLVDNSAVGFDPSLPWWLGMRVRPQFTQGADSFEHTLFDCGAFRVSLTPTGLSLLFATGDQAVLALTFGQGQDFLLVAACTGTSIHLHARAANGDEASVDTSVTAPVQSGAVPGLALGAQLAGGGEADIGVYDLVLKEEVWSDDSFLDEPRLYSAVAEFAADDTPESANALLRLDPSNALVPASAPSALFGGPGAKYDGMSWTPVPRDYLMQRGWLQLPAVSARFVNLEITNLPPSYHDVYVPVAREVKTFPPSVLSAYSPDQGERTPLAGELGLSVLAGFASQTPYSDMPKYTGTGGTGKGYTSTEVYTADDNAAGERLRRAKGAAWGYQNWHGDVSAPRWSQVGKHVYTTQSVAQTTKVAYDVGLSQIAFARTTYTGQDDTPAFEDSLFDQANIGSSNWVYDADGTAISSGAASRAVATSVPFGSTRQVTGVQFAAQQSQPSQLLPDPDFADPRYRNWNFVGDAQTPPQATVLPQVGTVLPVTRSLATGYWGDIAIVAPTWGDVGSFTYGDFVTSQRTAQTFGGVASDPFDQPVGGRLYAAARVVADQDLSSPLAVQIVDAVTGNVLAQELATVNRDQVTEWYTSYDIGLGGGYQGNTWGDLVGQQSTLASFSDSFARANSSSLGTMDSGQMWTAGGTGSLTVASDKATAASAGQRSQIDTQTPWGTLSVTLGNAVTTGTASASVCLLDLGGILVMNDGRVIGTNAAETFLTLPTIAGGDVFAFDFMPTKSVPAPHKASGSYASVQPWSIVVSRNGTWVNTISIPTGFTSVRALMGAATQTFTAFAWTPRYAQDPLSSSYRYGLPMPGDGSSAVVNASTNVWTDTEGHSWTYTNGWTFAAQAAYLGTPTNATAPPATAGRYTLTTDVSDEFGTAEFWAATVATPGSSDPVFLLDAGTGGSYRLALDSGGRVTDGSGTPLTGVLVPSLASAPLQVRYVNPAWLESALKTTYGVSPTATQALVFTQGGVILGIYSGTGLWSSTTRGFAGSSDGTGSGGAHSVVQGFSWTPEASQVIPVLGGATWGDVDGHRTKTWGDLKGHNAFNTDQLVARVVQTAPSQDSWDMDNLSVFADPIVWEFSNNGGASWIPADDIRNNPQGVALFPPPPDGGSVNIQTNQLQWRVTAWGPGCWVSHLVIRPWYQGLMRGMPPRPSFVQQGPNVNPYDHYAPIDQDPRFRVWHSPIPRDWFFAYRALDPTRAPADSTTQWTDVVVGDALSFLE